MSLYYFLLENILRRIFKFEKNFDSVDFLKDHFIEVYRLNCGGKPVLIQKPAIWETWMYRLLPSPLVFLTCSLKFGNFMGFFFFPTHYFFQNTCEIFFMNTLAQANVKSQAFEFFFPIRSQVVKFLDFDKKRGESGLGSNLGPFAPQLSALLSVPLPLRVRINIQNSKRKKYFSIFTGEYL